MEGQTLPLLFQPEECPRASHFPPPDLFWKASQGCLEASARSGLEISLGVVAE